VDRHLTRRQHQITESVESGREQGARCPQLSGLWAAVGHHHNGILLAGWTGERLAAALVDGLALPEPVLPSRYLNPTAG
jgi:glycine/D-amino acid oxidase-like deaminating enzyme